MTYRTYALIWQYEMAAMLSQIGCVTLPPETLDKLYDGKEITTEEKELFAEHPSVAAELLSHIPRLESVAKIIAQQQSPLDQGGETSEPKQRDTVTIGTQLLKLAMDYDHRISTGALPAAALQLIRSSTDMHDPVLVETLGKVLGMDKVKLVAESVKAKALFEGMVLNQDVYFEGGNFVVTAKGTELSLPMVKFLQGLHASKRIAEPLQVLTPKG